MNRKYLIKLGLDKVAPEKTLSNLNQRNFVKKKDWDVKEEAEETNERQSRLFKQYAREEQENG